MATSPALIPPVGGPSPSLKPNKKFTFGTLVKRITSIFDDDEDLVSQDDNTYIGTDIEARPAENTGPINTTYLGDYVEKQWQVEAGRMAAYTDYDQMDDEFPEISAALDIIAEFATQSDTPEAETFKIECTSDQALAKRLTDLARQLGLTDNCTPLAREVAKYGSTFLELIATSEDKGTQIVSTKPLDPATVKRNEDEFGRLKDEAFTQYQNGKDVAHFKKWQIYHFRWRRRLSEIYGNGLGQPARRVFKQWRSMEDGMVFARLYRSHMRFAFRIPCDGMTPAQTKEYMRTVIKEMKTKKRFDGQSGKTSTSPSPMLAGEDIFIPTRGDGKKGSSEVSVLQGQGGLGEIGDIEYYRNKTLTAFKTPKELLGIESPAANRSTYVIKDMNFARALRALQQIMACGIREIIERTLFLDGEDITTLAQWKVVFPAISTVDEKLQWETELLKAQVADTYHDKLGLLNDEYIYSHFLDLTPEEIEEQQAAQPNNPPQQRAVARAQILATTAKIRAGAPDSARPGTNGGPPVPPPRVSPFGTENDMATVRQVRALLKVPQDGDVRPGELKLARKLHEMREELGEFQIDREVFGTLYENAVSNGNGLHG